MKLSFLNKKYASKYVKQLALKRLAKPTAFKHWLQANSDKYIYVTVCRPQQYVTKQGYEINRLRLQIFVSNKSQEDLLKLAIKQNSTYLFDRKPDLVLTDFKIDNSSTSNEVELKHQQDFFLDVFYAEEYATRCDNLLANPFPKRIKDQDLAMLSNLRGVM